jgi:hypothetical protein
MKLLNVGTVSFSTQINEQHDRAPHAYSGGKD